MRALDRRAIWGLALLVALLAWVLFAAAGGSVEVFWRTPAVALVVGGAVLATWLGSPEMSWRSLAGAVRAAFSARPEPVEKTVITLVALAEIARRDGLLALDRPAGALGNDFLKRALHMAVDGVDARIIESVMDAEMRAVELRHTQVRGHFESMSRLAPVFGMIGTLVGLVMMLGKMSSPAMIGPGMAVAMLTTLYGLVFANVFCQPIARRLLHRSSEELLEKTIALKGALAIQAGEHPRLVAQRLRAYLPVSSSSVFMPRQHPGGHEREASAGARPVDGVVGSSDEPRNRGRQTAAATISEQRSADRKLDAA